MDFKQKIKLIISWTLVILIAGFIFGFSSQTASSSGSLSKEITKFFEKVIKIVTNDNLIISFDKLHHYVRKLAHFTIYFLLGLSLINALVTSKVYSYKLGFLLSSIYAITDEIHQMFIPGRSAQITDVLLDSFGAGVGIVFYFLLRKYIFKESV